MNAHLDCAAVCVVSADLGAFALRLACPRRDGRTGNDWPLRRLVSDTAGRMKHADTYQSGQDVKEMTG
jgi:hypothetical protein